MEIQRISPWDTTLHLSNDPEPKIAKQASRTMRQTSLIIEHQGASLYTLEKGKSADPSSKPSHSKLLSLSISSLDCRGSSLQC